MPPRTRTDPPVDPAKAPETPTDEKIERVFTFEMAEHLNRNVIILMSMVEKLTERQDKLVEAVNNVGSQQQVMTESAIASQTQLQNALRSGGLGGILKMAKG